MQNVNVNKLLNDIWLQFNTAGVVDDLDIIEHLAALLTEGHEPSDESLRPRMPITADLKLDDIRANLQLACEAVEDKGLLFNRYILFRLNERLPGGRYPTPRHIIESIYRLAQVEDEHKLADFACGSAGFLVPHAKHTTGVDIAPEWARLAWANRVLHGDADPNIRIGNALRERSAGGFLYDQTFDRIFMNPPFGEKLGLELVRNIVTTQVIWNEGKIGCPRDVASKAESRCTPCLRKVDK